MEFRETLPSPHALRSVAEGIQMKQPGTRIHKETKTSREEVKSNLEKNPERLFKGWFEGLNSEEPAGTINLHRGGLPSVSRKKKRRDIQETR